MATKLFQPVQRKEYVLNKMAQNTMQFLAKEFNVQRIYPKEVYGGWLQENRRRKAANGKLGWFSTGEGVNSFGYRVISTDKEETIAFTYNDYMMFADLGVGKGRKKEDVDRTKKAKFGQRYIQLWDPPHGKTHRPNMAMQWYSLRGRMEAYLQDFYGREIQASIYTMLSEVEEVQITDEE